MTAADATTELDGAPSRAESRMWLTHQLDPTGGQYNVGSEIRCDGPLDAARLRAALSAVVARHANLRARFPADAAGPRRRVGTPGEVGVEVVDVPGDDGLRAAAVRDRVLRSFDLEAGPLYRFHVLVHGPESWTLLLVFHHIVVDGWSVGIVHRDLAAAYRGDLGSAPPSPDVLVEREAGYVDGPDARREAQWWIDHLRGALVTPAPLARPVDERLAGAGPATTWRSQLDEPTTQALEGIVRDTSSSLYVLVLAAVVSWLAALVDDDVVVGSPVADRDDEISDVVGLAVNTVALRCALDRDDSFVAAVRAVRSSFLRSLAHRRMPFDEVVAGVDATRAAGENPLFDVLVAHQNVSGGVLALDGVRTRLGRSAVDQARLPLEITTWRRDEGLELRVGGLGDRYDGATLARIGEALIAVLRSVAGDPGRAVGELPLVGAAEGAVLAALEEGPRPVDRAVGSTLHGLVAARAGERPDATAVTDRDTSISFAELDTRARALAVELARRGVGPGDVVALALERSHRLVVAMLAVLHAGAAFVPLDVRHPDDRLRFMSTDAGTRVVVADGPVPWTGRGVAVVDVDAPPVGEEAALPAVGPGDLAYVMYTSGTSGSPKGVAIEHGSVVNTLAECVRRDDLGPEDHGLVTASHTFDVFLHEAFSPLLAGGSVRVVDHDELLEPEHMAPLLAAATTIQAVPGLMDHLLRAASRLDEQARRRMRRVMTGGDVVPPDLVREIAAVFPAARVSITYGPTEAAIFATCHVVERPAEFSGRPIGRPAAGVRVRVADPRGRPLPVGADGEILIAGRGVSRGYLDRPDENGRAFVEHDGVRWYRTGDRARRLPSGDLYFRGRDDSQVKVRGVRIELGEVEAVAAGADGVARAVAVAAGEGGTSRLDLYVVPEPVTSPAPAVEHWKQVFDRVYGSRNHEIVAGHDFTGWQSSYTGEQYPAEVMLDWQRATLERVRAVLAGRGTARRPVVAEVGCGTGLLVRDLAAAVARYHASDVSPRAVDDLRRRLRVEGLDHVDVTVAGATEASAPEPVDVVVVNSVTQYLPSAQDLERTLERCLAMLAPGGAVFVGDVRNLATGVDLHREVAAVRGVPEAERAEWACARAAEEEELLLDPRWFEDFAARHPRVTGVAARRRDDRTDSEMSRFRYDVVLDTAPSPASPDTDPVPRAGPDGPTHNDPGRPGRERDVRRAVRAQVDARLPHHMRPATVTVLERLPTTPNDKVDRAALPTPRRRVDEHARPPTALEQTVQGVWAAVLGESGYALDDDLFEVGGTSLLAVRIATALQAAGLALGAQDVMESRTIERMAALAGSQRRPERATVPSLDLPEATGGPSRPSPVPLRDASEVLLTGATGMLGVHLLRRLLESSAARVHCLVRSRPEQERARLREQVAWYFPDQALLDRFDERVVVFGGDVSRERLGLDATTWHDLAGRVEHVLHCAADVRHVADRDTVLASNLTGTREILRLVRSSGDVVLHHVSTVGVAGRVPRGAVVPCLDETTLDVGQIPTEAYSESKILAEGLVRRHLEQGFSGTVLRVGTVAPGRADGRFQRDLDNHFFSRFLRSTLLSGVVGAWPDRALGLVPVDVMAEAVVALADRRAESGGACFHVDTPCRVDHPTLAGMLGELGHRVDVVPADEFASVVHRAGERLGPDAISGLLPLLPARDTVGVPLDSRRSRQAFEDLGIQFPELDLAWLEAMVNNGVDRGYLPAAGALDAVGLEYRPVTPNHSSGVAVPSIQEFTS